MFIHNLLGLMEWHLMMFSIIYRKVSMLDDIKQREKFISFSIKQLVRKVNTNFVYPSRKGEREYQKLAAKLCYPFGITKWICGWSYGQQNLVTNF